jgi:uncharacterized protein YjbJ (UPF0337 family)
MNRDIIQGKWNEIKGKIKTQWSKFTDDEIGQMLGSYEELHGYLQKKYGYDKEKSKQEINNFISTHGLDT